MKTLFIAATDSIYGCNRRMTCDRLINCATSVKLSFWLVAMCVSMCITSRTTRTLCSTWGRHTGFIYMCLELTPLGTPYMCHELIPPFHQEVSIVFMCLELTPLGIPYMCHELITLFHQEVSIVLEGGIRVSYVCVSNSPHLEFHIRVTNSFHSFIKKSL